MVRAEGRLSRLFPFQPEYCVCEWLTRRGTWWEGVVTTLTSEWYGVWCGVERGRGLRGYLGVGGVVGGGVASLVVVA